MREADEKQGEKGREEEEEEEEEEKESRKSLIFPSLPVCVRAGYRGRTRRAMCATPRFQFGWAQSGLYIREWVGPTPETPLPPHPLFLFFSLSPRFPSPLHSPYYPSVGSKS